MSSKIIERIEATLGATGITQALVALSPSDLQSLLLEVFRARSRAVRAVDLLDPRRGLCAISVADARSLHAIDTVALESAPQFEAVELSPVGPVGSNVVLGAIDQNNTLAAIRNVEVLADPTVAQSLEAARRRRMNPKSVQRLCASQRLIRLQPFDNPDFSPHFRLFSLVTAGRDVGAFRFETDALREHIEVYLRLLHGLAPRGFQFGQVTVDIADSTVIDVLGIARDTLASQVRAHNHATGAILERARLPLPNYVASPAELTESPLRDHPSLLRFTRVHEHVVGPLAVAYPDVRFRYDLWRLEGSAYYRGICFRINVVDPTGLDLPLGDGGFTDWTQRLLSNAKERLLASGIGSELICKRYRTLSTPPA